MVKKVRIICLKSSYLETDKTIIFTLISALSGIEVGKKYLPKAKIQMAFGKTNKNMVQIIAPQAMLNGVNTRYKLKNAKVEA